MRVYCTYDQDKLNGQNKIMETTYINSKGEAIEISTIELPHLLFAIAKNSRFIGENKEGDESKARRETEVKAMHQEVLKRFGELKEKSAE